MIEDRRFFWNGPAGITAFTTTRQDMMPAGDFQEQELRRFLERFFLTPVSVTGMKQVHGDRIEAVDRFHTDRVVLECDGLWTSEAQAALTVRSADCLPVIAFDKVRRKLAVIHAGWRGVKAGILEKMIREMDAVDLTLGIGPAIGRCCYEVGPEFKSSFAPYLSEKEGRSYFDLKGAAIAQLIGAGVLPDQIDVAPWCTACETELCPSFRRDREHTGRMVTVAWINN